MKSSVAESHRDALVSSSVLEDSLALSSFDFSARQSLSVSVPLSVPELFLNSKHADSVQAMVE